MGAALKLETPQLSWEELLLCETHTNIRHEWVGGAVYAMAGGTMSHNTVALNIAAELRQRLKGSPCRAFINDMKLRLRQDGEDTAYYPDVMVTCGVNAGRGEVFVTQARLIVEVLSPSTARIDRREKFLAYQQIPELEVYLLVEPEAPLVCVYRRSQHWQLETYEGLEASIELPEIDAALSLSEIYEGVALG
jgi:Uma2 family endonuclease